ncbi:ubiquitin-conjugating enzyme E2 R2-like [Drosophila guanche]|uniref:Blast:Ubiquitin-conjugating enzyme E2 R2 n=1 Tax=Drosophila guanche TaxID=7266 RepID=A0A3B0JWH5_DROGU|nr:ubiquitin-conjugating enzyme E2 R2-like [Drosophila guanche]SPP78069.1 blast:Ubiquitin-conjugating enzyme E2 R2 [Drosophila guanche]
MGEPKPTETQPTIMAVGVLYKEIAELKKGKLEGFRVRLVREDDPFEWDVGIYGPPNTFYHGAYLKATMRFPFNYPMQSPEFYFRTTMFHPNVHANGMVYMSILHDGTWLPTMSASTVLLSLVSLLTSPDTEWPCNMDAAHLYNQWRNSHGKDTSFLDRLALQKTEWKEMAMLDDVVIPDTVEEYCRTARIEEQLDEEFILSERYDCSEYGTDDSSTSEAEEDETDD